MTELINKASSYQLLYICTHQLKDHILHQVKKQGACSSLLFSSLLAPI